MRHIMPIFACSSVRSAKHGHDTSHITYMTPARPRSETYTRRFAHGGRAVARRLLARLAIVKLCARTPLRYVTDATSPPLFALLLVGFLAPVRPQGLPLDLNPLYIPLLLDPPIKPLPYSACFSPRRYAHGGKTGRETIARYARNRLAFCDRGSAALRYERKTSPPPIATLLVLCRQGQGERLRHIMYICTWHAPTCALPGTYIHDKSHITYVTPAHPRRCLRSRCERRHLLPSAPNGGSL